MGFDLWSMLGVSPAVGFSIVLGGVACAVLLGVAIAWRRSRTSHVLRTGLAEDR